MPSFNNNKSFSEKFKDEKLRRSYILTAVALCLAVVIITITAVIANRKEPSTEPPVKDTEKIDLVVNLEPWQEGKMYDRLGLEDETIEILGLELPALTIPVSPGRNLAIIMEIAAMNNRQKRMGYNTAEEFNKHLMNQMNIQE